MGPGQTFGGLCGSIHGSGGGKLQSGAGRRPHPPPSSLMLRSGCPGEQDTSSGAEVHKHVSGTAPTPPFGPPRLAAGRAVGTAPCVLLASPGLPCWGPSPMAAQGGLGRELGVAGYFALSLGERLGERLIGALSVFLLIKSKSGWGDLGTPPVSHPAYPPPCTCATREREMELDPHLGPSLGPTLLQTRGCVVHPRVEKEEAPRLGQGQQAHLQVLSAQCSS